MKLLKIDFLNLFIFLWTVNTVKFAVKFPLYKNLSISNENLQKPLPVQWKRQLPTKCDIIGEIVGNDNKSNLIFGIAWNDIAMAVGQLFIYFGKHFFLN